MPRISDEFLQEIKLRNDITEVVSSYVSLRRSGRNLSGLCPFHNEKSPSFTVFPDTQSYYCFGCNAGGDVITFIREIEHLDYVEAVEQLANRVGLSLPQNGEDDARAKLKTRVLAANKAAARFYFSNLSKPCGRAGLRYLRGRKLTDTTIRRFGLGFAPDEWSALCDALTAQGFSEEELVKADLALRTRKGGIIDRFRNRVMFPIIDLRGNVTAFGGRVMDDSKPKYLNTSETPAFHKSNGLFALNIAKKNDGRLILCEGYMDVIALHQAGFPYAVATLGTALTGEQARIMSRYADEVVISYDSDSAGRKAAARAINILNEVGLKVKVLQIPDAKDPDEYIKKFGAERFARLLSGVSSDIEYNLLNAAKEYDLQTSDGKVNFLKRAAEILSTLASPVAQDVYAAKLAGELQVSKDMLMQQVKSAAASRQRRSENKRLREMTSGRSQLDNVNPQRRQFKRAAAAEEGLIYIMLMNPDFYEFISSRISREDFVTDFNARVFEVISDRLADGRSVDLTMLSQSFTPAEMGQIVEIQTREVMRENSKEEAEHCINIILDEHYKMQRPAPESMDKDDLMAELERLRKEKKKGAAPQN